ncbi:hypothetical protein BGZ73_000639 [Actinomortierella ambigua]|nr:hypothetical protein BGZ73_000639 [Actinomortierella ambigua]
MERERHPSPVIRPPASSSPPAAATINHTNVSPLMPIGRHPKSLNASVADLSDKLGSPRTSRRLPIQTYLNTFPEWHRPERITSLYSSLERFKPGTEYSGNEFAYKTNLQWWIKVITGSARRGLLSNYQPTKAIRFYTNDYSPSISSTYGVADTEPTGSSLGLLEVDEDVIVARFTRGCQRPVCISTVLDEMKNQGLVVPRSEYLPWGGVGMPSKMVHMFIKVPISWSFRRLNIGSPVSSTPKAYTSIGLASARFDPRKDSTQNGRIGLGIGIGNLFGGSSSSRGAMPDKETYVILDTVKEAAERILQLHEQSSRTYYKSDNLMTFADFRELFSRRALEPLALNGDLPLSGASSIGQELILTDRDLEIVLRALQYEYHALITGPLDPSKPATELTDREYIIKFVEPEDMKELAPVDRGTIELREMGRKLQSQVQDLEHRVEELTVRAKSCLARQQKIQAMTTLKSRKILKSVLEKRCSSLETVNAILFRIQTAQSDMEILQTLEKGSQTLNSVLTQKNEEGVQILSVDNIENTMDQLAEILADQEEVDEAVRNANELVAPQVDEADLLEELDKLSSSPSVEAPSTLMDTEMISADTTVTPQPAKTTVAALNTIAQPRSSSPVSTSTSTKESPTTIQAQSMKTKRVAESTDQTVKQRKLSQESVVNKRETDNQQISSETSSSDQESVSVSESPQLELADQTPSRASIPDTTSATGNISWPTIPEEQQQSSVQQSTVELGVFNEQDEAELEALMMELGELKAPDAEIASTSTPRKRQEPQILLAE